MAERRRALTRRGLLRAGGAGAAGAAVLGTAGLGSARAQGAGALDRPNALLIVLDGARADFVGAYDDSDEHADTPEIDSLVGDSLRFRRAAPESMAPFPARRTVLTGKQAFPYRDWRPTDGVAQAPGWNGIHPRHPLMTEAMAGAGVTTVYVSDNPLLDDPRFADVRRRPPGSPPASPQLERFVAPVLARPDARAGAPGIARAVRGGIEALGELRRRQPFFLGVDAFDATEATNPTPVYGRRGRDEQGPGRNVAEEGFPALREVDPSDDEVGRVRSEYAAELGRVDAEVGRLLNRLDDLGLAETTVVYLVSATAMALGEHGIFGSAPAAGHEDVYRPVHLIRDPDRRRAGEESQYFAMPHDVATTMLSFMGLSAPGKMEGEDLTALLEEQWIAPRWHFTSALGSTLASGDGRYVLVSDFEGQRKRLYDADPDEHEDRNSGDDDYVERDEDIDIARRDTFKAEELFRAAMTAAGGTLPVFGDQGPIRPREEVEDDTDEDDDSRLGQDDDLNFSDQTPGQDGP